jgi:hypothetical protein
MTFMLTLCTRCSRHVRHDEARCPFCTTPITTQPKIPARLGRAGRAAILFGVLSATAGCGGAQSTDTTVESAPPDQPPPDETPPDEPPDVAPVPAYGVPAEPPPESSPPDDGSNVAMYGVPGI